MVKLRKSVRFSDSDSCKDSCSDSLSDSGFSDVFVSPYSPVHPTTQLGSKLEKPADSSNIGKELKQKEETNLLTSADKESTTDNNSITKRDSPGLPLAKKQKNSKTNTCITRKSFDKENTKLIDRIRPYSAPNTFQHRDIRSGQYFQIQHYRKNSVPVEVRVFKLGQTNTHEKSKLTHCDSKFAGKQKKNPYGAQSGQNPDAQHPSFLNRSSYSQGRDSAVSENSFQRFSSNPGTLTSGTSNQSPPAIVENSSVTDTEDRSGINCLKISSDVVQVQTDLNSDPDKRVGAMSGTIGGSQGVTVNGTTSKMMYQSGMSSQTPFVKDKQDLQGRDMMVNGTMSGMMYQSGMSSLAPRDKQELHDLNNRLSRYITQVREMNQSAGKFESSAFQESIQILEGELVKMKEVYEKELEMVRSKTEMLTWERSQLSLQLSKSAQVVSDLENRLAVELDKNHRTTDEKNNLQMSLQQKSLDMENMKNLLQQKEDALNQAIRDRDNFQCENDGLRKRLDGEMLEREKAANLSVQYEEKLSLQEQLQTQKIQELSGRLQAASNTILVLEGKIRELSSHDNNLAEMLQQVRQAAEAELVRYQHESRETYNHNLTELKVQLDMSDKKVGQLTDETIDLTTKLGEVTANMRSLEGQVVSLEHQKKSLEDMLAKERERSQSQVHDMEAKLRDLQELLVTKMREVSNACEARATLQTELESYRTLLAEEERRLRRGQDGAPSSPKLAFEPLGSSVSLRASYHGNTTNNHTHVGLSKEQSVLQNSNVTFQPLGPVRSRSGIAPNSRLNLVSSSLGQGQDYFDQMFNDLARTSPNQARRPPPKTVKILPNKSASPGGSPTPNDPNSGADRPQNPSPPVNQITPSTTTHDYTTATSSATGDIKILEVHEKGQYIRLINSSSKDEEFGGHLLQQNVGKHPVAIFRFPPRLSFPSNGLITVWSGSNDPLLHQPPSDFVFKEQQKWGTGPECTTILCKPSGQAIAWTTAAHRFTQDAYDMATPGTESPVNAQMLGGQTSGEDMKVTEQKLPVLSGNVNDVNQESAYLRREKAKPPSLNAPSHPHGQNPQASAHPHSGLARSKTYGNDNSSVNRQARAHSGRPDPVPGAPYAGAAGQRMGSARLMKYSQPTVMGSGQLANKSGMFSTPPPNTFQTSRNRYETGLDQVRSQHHVDFQPPMPRPPLFSTW